MSSTTNLSQINWHQLTLLLDSLIAFQAVAIENLPEGVNYHKMTSSWLSATP